MKKQYTYPSVEVNHFFFMHALCGSGDNESEFSYGGEGDGENAHAPKRVF